MTTTVVIEREHGTLAGYLQNYEVLIDGEAYGSIGSGESFAVQLAPGQHSVKFRVGQSQSPVLKVFVGEHRTRITGLANMWRAMGLFELFAPAEWVAVREEPGAPEGTMVADIAQRLPQRRRNVAPGAALAALMPRPSPVFPLLRRTAGLQSRLPAH